MASSKYAQENVNTTPVELRCDPSLPRINVFEQFGGCPTQRRNIEIGGRGFWWIGHYYMPLIVDGDLFNSALLV